MGLSKQQLLDIVNDQIGKMIGPILIELINQAYDAGAETERALWQEKEKSGGDPSKVVPISPPPTQAAWPTPMPGGRIVYGLLDRVVVETKSGKITYEGTSCQISERSARMVAALAEIAPKEIELDKLLHETWDTVPKHGEIELKGLIETANATMRAIGLAIAMRTEMPSRKTMLKLSAIA